MNIVDVIRTLAGFAWLGAIGFGVLAVIRASRNQSAKATGSTVIVLLVVAAILTTLGAGLVFVEASERGVVRTIRAGGIRSDALGPGLHWIIPVVESVVPYSISNQTYTMSAVAGEGQVQGDDSIRARTKDGQEVIIDASVIYQIDPAKVVRLHIVWQNRYQDGIVRPEARGVIRDAVSQYGVEEVVSTKRAEMVQIISDELSASLAQNNLLLLDFVLRDIHFSEGYAAAVEQKQIAEQQAQQAALTVEQKKQEAEQARQVAQGQADAAVIAARGAAEARLIQAEAEARANQLLAESLTPALVQYQYVLRLAPGVQTIFIPSGNQFILPLPDTSTPPTATPPTTTP
ncbi:MAG: prohibitin family protein [Anaerolineae bacterium]|nr:prohibitin family protein [Anaerolineae bacterium]MCI0608531.1 prohibitin family protein [Anaerolineae bacterium]